MSELKRFEKEMHDLNVVINQYCTNNERVSELVEWYRKECQARPEMYKGDEVVIKAIRDAAATGLTLNFSLMEAYRILKAKYKGMIKSAETKIEKAKSDLEKLDKY